MHLEIKPFTKWHTVIYLDVFIPSTLEVLVSVVPVFGQGFCVDQSEAGLDQSVLYNFLLPFLVLLCYLIQSAPMKKVKEIPCIYVNIVQLYNKHKILNKEKLIKFPFCFVIPLNTSNGSMQLFTHLLYTIVLDIYLWMRKVILCKSKVSICNIRIIIRYIGPRTAIWTCMYIITHWGPT